MVELKRVDIIGCNGEARLLEGKLKGEIVKAELIEKPSYFVKIKGNRAGPNLNTLIKSCPKEANAYVAKSFMEVWTLNSINCTYNVLYLRITYET